MNLSNLPILLNWALEHGVHFELFTSVAHPHYMSIDILGPKQIEASLLAFRSLAEDPRLSPRELEYLANITSALASRPPIGNEAKRRLRQEFLDHMFYLTICVVSPWLL